MNRHLSDEQLVAAVLCTCDGETTRHLAECNVCGEEAKSFAAIVGAAREQTRQMACQPEAFWRRQREGIRARVSARQSASPLRRWMWVTASALLIWLASAILFRNSAPPVQSTVRTDPDDELLLSVQQSLQNDVPQALQPAALLTAEIDRAASARRTP